MGDTTELATAIYKDCGEGQDKQQLQLQQQVRQSSSLTNIEVSDGVGGDATAVRADEVTCSRQSVLTFHDVSYTVRVREKGCSSTLKAIIKNVSGVMHPGMNAIMGPTGSGKTTLMDILAQRVNIGRLDGEVLINSKRLPRNFNYMSGYVVQDDIVMGTLTVRENLYFSASLRLPRTMSKSEKEARVDMVLADLGLTEVQNSKIGNEFIRGVSGGERKRTNIGMELIIQPNILFLDEPTTGLDAHTAVNVMQLLRDLGAKGKTIVFAIHQPRYSIFKLFDSLTLLSNGQTVYHGEAAAALNYLEENGFHCEEHDNPADFVLDTVQSIAEGDEDGVAQGISLANSYRDSHYFQKVKTELDSAFELLQQSGGRTDDKTPSSTYANNFFFQMWVCMKRAATNVIRSPMLSIFRIVMMVVFGFIIGLIYFQLSNNSKGIQNRVGGFFFIIINLVFGNMGTIELFMSERSLYRHEASSGYYHIFAYFLARVLVDVALVNILPFVLFSTVVYWMMGFVNDAGKFFYFMLIVVFTALAGNGATYAVGTGVKVFAVGSLMTALIYTIMMIFGGLFLNLQSIPNWLRWLQWLSIFRYSLEAMSVNELKGSLFCDDQYRVNGTCSFNIANLGSCQPAVINGTAYLIEQDFDIDNAMWYDPMALVLFFIGFCFIAALELRFLRKNR